MVDVAFSWPSGYGFTAQSLKIRARPWSPRRFRISAAGGVSAILPYGPAPDGAPRPAVTVAGETLRGHATFRESAWPAAIDLTADTVTATRNLPGGASGRELSASTVTLSGSLPETPPKADTDVAGDLTLRLLDLSAPALEGNPLGATIRQTDLHLQLLGIPPGAIDPAGLKAWRDAGGSIDLLNLSIQWGQLGLTANGTMAFDANMQPEGAFSAQLTGFDQTIDALAGAGWIRPGSVGLAKLALGLAAMPGPDGKQTVKTPLTIQNRHISLGPVKLGQMPELKIE